MKRTPCVVVSLFFALSCSFAWGQISAAQVVEMKLQKDAARRATLAASLAVQLSPGNAKALPGPLENAIATMLVARDTSWDISPEDGPNLPPSLSFTQLGASNYSSPGYQSRIRSNWEPGRFILSRATIHTPSGVFYENSSTLIQPPILGLYPSCAGLGVIHSFTQRVGPRGTTRRIELATVSVPR